MKIIIEPQLPDGINLSVTDLVLDTTDDAIEVIKLLIKRSKVKL